MKRVYVSILSFFIIFVSRVYAWDGSYEDGVYVGEHSFIKAEVTVKEGEITDIKILRHGGGGETYEEMVEDLIPLIIENQSIEVDAITGATVSSNNLKKAVENALSGKYAEDQRE